MQGRRSAGVQGRRSAGVQDLILKFFIDYYRILIPDARSLSLSKDRGAAFGVTTVSAVTTVLAVLAVTAVTAVPTVLAVTAVPAVWKLKKIEL